ncbi:aromatic acid exporter family protein [Streptomyces sp. DSM 42041]|uniref:Aromatic acid exporter family protein n=1 Tax=Streptomyces hazeniae TaxID=3075538 RepID=A0ABU2NS46_9ACTN|nr:aromatic acid exporter family protein [Streptomyces sp. DSM 42041]MDT0379570.1 aromatic acid exporter family protein [Streptomyces sp. DSM 42041]
MSRKSLRKLRTEVPRLRKHPDVVQTFRSTTAATLAFVVALVLTDSPAPLLAPLTALLVVQVTLYATLTSGVRRVNAVVAGVTIAVGFSNIVGLSWWSLALLIFASLAAGHLVRAHQFVPEVAISAMLVLGVTQHTDLALVRIVETLIGAGVGLVFNFLFVPPVWVEPAEDEILQLARRMWWLLRHVGDELGERTPVERISTQLHAARRLDHDVGLVDASLTRAEESLRFNPRVKEALLSRIVLRTGLDTLEICAVVVRTTSRTLTDLARERHDEPLFPPETVAAVRELLRHVGEAVYSFAVLVTSPVSSSAEEAETQLQTELAACGAVRERVAQLLLARVQEHPRQWQLHGALLAEFDRILDELAVEKRSLRLAEELDRAARERHDRRRRFALLPRLRRG